MTTNNLSITKERVKEWSACTDGYRWFLEKFPQGGEFAQVHKALQAEKRYADSAWLANHVFAELDAPTRVHQIVKISGADSDEIAKLAEGGGDTNAATTGEGANAATTGEGANAATTGYGANAATTGDRANAATTGEGANAATTGEGANAATTGYGANAATTGDRANAATTGYGANAATTGEGANAATTGDRANAATTGDRANAATTGEGAVAASLGRNCKAKAEVGGAIVLVHRAINGAIAHIRASKVGENGIKPGVWYSLNANGEFREESE